MGEDSDSLIVAEAFQTARLLTTARSEAHLTGDYALWEKQYEATMERLAGLIDDGPAADTLLYMASLIDGLAQLPSVVAISANEVAAMAAKELEESLAEQSVVIEPVADTLRKALDPERLLELALGGIEATGWRF